MVPREGQCTVVDSRFHSWIFFLALQSIDFSVSHGMCAICNNAVYYTGPFRVACRRIVPVEMHLVIIIPFSVKFLHVALSSTL